MEPTEGAPKGGRGSGTEASEESDDALMTRVAAQDLDAFRMLYDRYQRRVFAFLRRRLKDGGEVEDVFHETMMELWRSAGRYEGRSGLSAWLLRIARNKSVDALRKRKAGMSEELDEAATEAIEDDSASAFDQVAAAGDAAALRYCLQKLSAEKREAVELIFLEGLRYHEAAAAIERPEGTIKARIHHAKAALKKCLAAQGVASAH